MSVLELENLINIYDVMTSTKDDTTGSLTSQLGNVTASEVISDGAETWSHFGFASRPSEALPGSDDAPQVLAIARSDRDLVVAERDVRGQQIYGNLKAGETCLYAAGKDAKAQARILLKADGGINLYTKQGNTDSGLGIAMLINAADDSITLTNSKGIGIRISDDGVQIIGKGGLAGITVSDKVDISSASVSVPNLNVLGGLAVGAGGMQVGGPSILAVTTTGALTAAHITGTTTIPSPLVTTGVVPGSVTITSPVVLV